MAVDRALEVGQTTAAAALMLRNHHSAEVISRGFNYATAFEIALKLQELSYTNCAAFSADFLHGPLAIVDEGFPVIMVAASGPVVNEMRELRSRLAQRGAQVVVIGDDASVADPASIPIIIPRLLPEWLSPLALVVPGQVMAMDLGRLRGHNVDAPRSIRKVTETY